MKYKILLKFLFFIAFLSVLQEQTFAQSHAVKDITHMQWWKDAKFGLFLHWGLYSVTAGDWKGKPVEGGEGFMLNERIPLKEYAQIASDFNPVKFNAEQWVLTAKKAGMKYIVITAKHHDGFAMYDSKASDYNIVKCTPFHQDPMKALAAACKKGGVKLCFYYSLGRDWQDPDVPTNWPVKGGRSNTWDYPNEDSKVLQRYFDRKVIPQVTELLTQYGPIGVIWFDTFEMITKAQSKELQTLIRKLQPDCIINNRIGNGFGDYSVSEQSLSTGTKAKPWESCITLGQNWAYVNRDTVFKSPELLVRDLIEVVSKGGNLLLNAGPMGNGAFPQRSIEILSAISKWMKVNQEAIYDTRPWKISGEDPGPEMNKEKHDNTGENTLKDFVNHATPKSLSTDIRFTTKGDNLYVFARSWKESKVFVRSLALGEAVIKNIKMLGSAKKLKWKQGKDGLIIYMPVANKSTNIPVFVFKIEV
jgi:alpha-L-fucosidase